MDKEKPALIIGTDICPDLSELMGMDDIPMILVKGDKKSGADDFVGNDKTTADNG